MSPNTFMLGAGVVFLWASAFVGIQRASTLVDPGTFALYRLLVSSLTLYIISRLLGMKRIHKKDRLRVAISGISGSTVYILFVNLAQPWVTSTESCIIINTVPIFTTLGAWAFLKQGIRSREIIGLSVSFSGILFLALGKGDMKLGLGLIFLLLASLSMAVSTVLQKELLSRYSSIQVIGTGIWYGTVAALPFTPNLIHSLGSMVPEAHFIIIYLGVFPSALAYLAWGALLKSTTTQRAASLLYVVPVLVALMGYLFLGEHLTPSLLMGGLLALGGVALIQFPKPMKPILHLNFMRKSA